MPLKRQSRNRVNEIHGALLEMIESDAFQVGSKLPTENALASSYGVSRPVIREAIARLCASGHVRTERGRGSFVEDINGLGRFDLHPITSIDDLLNWQELRLGIETEAARSAATRHSDEDLTAMTRLHNSMAVKDRPIASFADLDHEFHMAIASATNNSAIINAQQTLGRHIKGWISTILHVEQHHPLKRNEYLLSEHAAILAAIKSRDPDRAASAIRNHIENGRTRFLTRMARSPN